MRKTEKLCSFSFSLFSRERFIAWDKRRLFFHTCFYPPSHTPTSRHGLPFPFFPSKKPHHLCSFRPASISRPKKKQEKQKKGGPTAAATRTSFSSPFPSPPPTPPPLALPHTHKHPSSWALQHLLKTSKPQRKQNTGIRQKNFKKITGHFHIYYFKRNEKKRGGHFQFFFEDFFLLNKQQTYIM